MSVEAVKGFIEKIGRDEALAEKVKDAGVDVSEIIALGKENGFEFTAENLKTVHEEMNKSGAELSDEDLEKVAGGFVMATVVVASAAAVSVAAAVTEVAIAAAPAVGKK